MFFTDKGILTLSVSILILLSIMTVSGNDLIPGDDIIEFNVYGSVLDNDTGEPIPNVCVYIFDDDFVDYQRDLSDEEGRYDFRVKRPGLYYITANKDGYMQQDALIGVDLDGRQFDFHLDPLDYNYVIYGEVSDINTNDYLSDVRVTLHKLFVTGVFKPRLELITDESGAFSFDLNNGTYRLTFEKDDYYAEFFQFEISGNGMHLNKVLTPYFRGVKGIVKDEGGSPIDGATLCLRNEDLIYYGTTDEDGSYSIMIPYAGDYTLTAYADGYRSSAGIVRISEDVVLKDMEMGRARVPLLYRILYTILEFLGSMFYG